MQKKLLTLAVAGALGAPAVALAQVEVYGTIHMSLNYMDYGTSTLGSAIGHEIRRCVARVERRRARTGEPWRRADCLVPGRDQCLDGALEQHCAHFELRLA